MKGLLRLLMLVGLVIACAGCRGYREYVRDNNRLGPVGMYDRRDYREYTQQNDLLGASGYYYTGKLAQDVNKFNDDVGPKHVYYYE
jgi:hypothetical protein